MGANKKNNSGGDISYAISFMAQLGFTMAGCIVIGVLLGRWLDGLLGTSPWMVLVCSLLGVVAAFMSIYKIASRK